MRFLLGIAIGLLAGFKVTEALSKRMEQRHVAPATSEPPVASGS